MITTVIFDMNGIIIDDEPLHERAFRETLLKPYGINLTSEEYKRHCMGKSDESGYKAIINTYNLKNIDFQELINKKSKIYWRLIQDNIQSFPGVIKLINHLNQNFTLALTTSATRNEAEMVLNYFGIKKNFKIIITAEDITKSKPDPEPYLITAKKLQEEPKCCLVVEDSKAGIQSAKKASMKCIAVTTTHKRSELQNADLIVDSFIEITDDIIKTLS
jgi:beta-phosphoglucomutase